MLWPVVLMGCAVLFVPAVDDVRLESAEVVSSQSPEGKRVFGKSMAVREGVLKIRLSTSTDIGALAQKSELNIGQDATLCPMGKGEEISGYSKIYYQDMVVNYFGTGSVGRDEKERYQALAAKVPEGERFVYHVYLDYKMGPSRNLVHGQPDLRGYNLVEDPQDVCVRIRGGNMIGGGFRSNIVVIPKDQISAALKRAFTR